MASFPTSVKMGGSGRTGPKGGTSSLAVTDTCEGINSVMVHIYGQHPIKPYRLRMGCHSGSYVCEGRRGKTLPFTW